MPENTVYVGRPTIFGNPVRCQGPDGCNNPSQCCVDVFEEYLLSGLEARYSRTGSLIIAIDAKSGYPRRDEMVRRLPELRGKNLACWCPLDQPCHADVLLEVANR
jgi:hypothetical protein